MRQEDIGDGILIMRLGFVVAMTIGSGRTTRGLMD